MKFMLGLLLITFSWFSFSANVLKTSGYISKTRTFAKNLTSYNVNDTGLFVIYMDSLGGACGTHEKRVAISSDHPLYQTVVSTALAAKASKAKIELWHLDTCSQRYNAWDFALIDLI